MSSQVTRATLWFHQETGGKHAHPRGLLDDRRTTSARGIPGDIAERLGVHRKTVTRALENAARMASDTGAATLPSSTTDRNSLTSWAPSRQPWPRHVGSGRPSRASRAPSSSSPARHLSAAIACGRPQRLTASAKNGPTGNHTPAQLDELAGVSHGLIHTGNPIG